MSTAAQIAANTINAQSSTGARTEAGHAASSINATRNGLFARRDFVRPGEEEAYARDRDALAESLAPLGPLECSLVDEIHTAIWRLRRCGQVEANLTIVLDDGRAYIFDPMETGNAAAEKTQLSVDRARSQAHRLLHKCTAELRKLQTERQYRNESLPTGTDISHLGICDLPAIYKDLDRQFMAEYRRKKSTGMAETNGLLDIRIPSVPKSGSNCKTDSAPIRQAA
jgi:hypothetical protein